MTASITFNPVNTTNAAGSFGVDWGGGFQGMMLDDPAVRYQLAGGYLASTETLPMWGGVGINEAIPTPNSTTLPSPSIGSVITRATAIANGVGQLTGFSVFNQNNAAITTPQSPVPLIGTGQTLNFARFGTNARVWLQMAPALTSLYASNSLTQVSWDFNAQQLIPYQAAYASASVASATYTSSTGVLAVTFGAAPASTTPTVGATFTISGMTTSAGSAALVNGDFTLVSSASAGTVLNFNIGIGLGTITINSSTGTLAAGGGAVPLRAILRVESNNSMVVSYNATTGFATWNRAGSTALALL